MFVMPALEMETERPLGLAAQAALPNRRVPSLRERPCIKNKTTKKVDSTSGTIRNVVLWLTRVHTYICTPHTQKYAHMHTEAHMKLVKLDTHPHSEAIWVELSSLCGLWSFISPHISGS